MMKDKALFGLVSGVSLVVATLIGVALLNTPSAAESATAPSEISQASCAGHPASLEQAYGVRQGSTCTSAK